MLVINRVRKGESSTQEVEKVEKELAHSKEDEQWKDNIIGAKNLAMNEMRVEIRKLNQ